MERKTLTFREMIANMCGAIEEMVMKRTKERTLTTPEVQTMINAYGKCERLTLSEINFMKMTGQEIKDKDFDHVFGKAKK